MIKRIALVIGGIAAAGVLALGLAAAGFGPVAIVPRAVAVPIGVSASGQSSVGLSVSS